MDDYPVSYPNLQPQVDKLKKAGDKLQADLCKLGEYMSDILSGRKTIEEVKDDPAVVKLMGEHLKHRRKDRDRYMDTVTKTLKTAKTNAAKDRLIAILAEVSKMDDQEILTTDMF